MTSGKRITEADKHHILRLLGYKTVDGDWMFSEAAIAHKLSMHPATVHEHVRQAAVAWGVHTQWRAADWQEPE